MLNNSYCQLKGISGTGKGTRTWQLQNFLATKFRGEIFSMRVDINGPLKPADIRFHKKPFVLGVYFPEINVLFTGKLVKSNRSGLISWNSLDYLRGTTRSDKELRAILAALNDKNIIVEGYPVTITTNYEVQNIRSAMGYDNYYYHYFLYKTFEDLQTRMVNRSGKEIKGTCWGVQAAAIRELKRHKALLDSGEFKYNFKLECSFFDEDHAQFGCSYLDFVGLEHLKSEFVDYAAKHSVLRSVDKLKENISMWGDSLTLYDNIQRNLRKEVVPVSFIYQADNSATD